MVLSYDTSPGYHMAIDKTEQYQAAAFDEGHYLQIEVAALLKNSPNQELGQKFLQFLLSKEAQSALPLTNVMYPSTDIGDALPEEFALIVLALMTGLPLIALFISATPIAPQELFSNTYFRRVIWFSFYQALLSASLAVGLAIPVAQALSREQNFPGRKLLINLYSLS